MTDFRARLQARYAREAPPATQADLKRLQRTMDDRLPPRQSGGLEMSQKAVRMMGRGIADIARSLNSPSDSRRPRISQLPARRSDMGIIGSLDNDRMKTPGLRGKDMRGRRIK